MMTTEQHLLRAQSLAITLAAATLHDSIDGEGLDAVHAHNVSLAIVESLALAIESC
jgi:hypothetical protein